MSAVDVKLIIFKSDGSRKVIPVKPGRYTVGRQQGAGIRIPLPSVSREHCELVHEGNKLSVRDLGSSNGTFKNNERITETTLAPGDILAVGQFSMTVQINGKPEKIKAPATPNPEDSALLETPPIGMRANPGPDTKGLAETKTRAAPPPPAAPLSGPPGGAAEDSSIFDFDFDFEDEDRPKL